MSSPYIANNNSSSNSNLDSSASYSSVKLLSLTDIFYIVEDIAELGRHLNLSLRREGEWAVVGASRGTPKDTSQDTPQDTIEQLIEDNYVYFEEYSTDTDDYELMVSVRVAVPEHRPSYAKLVILASITLYDDFKDVAKSSDIRTRLQPLFDTMGEGWDETLWEDEGTLVYSASSKEFRIYSSATLLSQCAVKMMPIVMFYENLTTLLNKEYYHNHPDNHPNNHPDN